LLPFSLPFLLGSVFFFVFLAAGDSGPPWIVDLLFHSFPFFVFLRKNTL